MLKLDSDKCLGPAKVSSDVSVVVCPLAYRTRIAGPETPAAVNAHLRRDSLEHTGRGAEVVGRKGKEVLLVIPGIVTNLSAIGGGQLIVVDREVPVSRTAAELGDESRAPITFPVEIDGVFAIVKSTRWQVVLIDKSRINDNWLLAVTGNRLPYKTVVAVQAQLAIGSQNRCGSVISIVAVRQKESQSGAIADIALFMNILFGEGSYPLVCDCG